MAKNKSVHLFTNLNDASELMTKKVLWKIIQKPFWSELNAPKIAAYHILHVWKIGSSYKSMLMLSRLLSHFIPGTVREFIIR